MPGRIPERRLLAERTAAVETCRRVGHWEGGDSIIGAGHRQAIVSLVERTSGYCLLAYVPHKASGAVSDAIIERWPPSR